MKKVLKNALNVYDFLKNGKILQYISLKTILTGNNWVTIE